MSGRTPVLSPAVTCAALLLCLGFLMAPVGWAQAAGVISGTVTDEDNRPLPGVTITLSSADDSLRRSIVTNAMGRYEIGNLPTGVFGVAAQLPGFRAAVKTQRVTEDRRELWLVMEPGELRETIPAPEHPAPRVVPLSSQR